MSFKLIILSVTAILLTSCATKENKIAINQSPKISSSKPLDENEMISIINHFRATNKICRGATQPLVWSKELEKVALEHSMDMAANKKLSHIGSGTGYDITAIKLKTTLGSTPVQRVIASGYPTYERMPISENITFNTKKDERESLLTALESFAKDPAHCQILISPKYQDIGAAYVEGADGKKYWTFNFAAQPKTNKTNFDF